MAASISRISSALAVTVLRRILLGLMAGAGAGGVPRRTARGRRPGGGRRGGCWLAEEAGGSPCDARECAGGGYEGGTEPGAVLRPGGEGAATADYTEGEEGSGPAGVDQIDGPAEALFEGIFE